VQFISCKMFMNNFIRATMRASGQRCGHVALTLCRVLPSNCHQSIARHGRHVSGVPIMSSIILGRAVVLNICTVNFIGYFYFMQTFMPLCMTLKPRLHWPIVGPTSRADDRPNNAISVKQPVAPPLDGYLATYLTSFLRLCTCCRLR